MKKIILVSLLLLIPLTDTAQANKKAEPTKTCILGDCVNGKGILSFSDGDRYVGDFKDGKYHGKGVLISTNGDRYEGDFKDGKAEGKGVWALADGRRYEGDWKGDLPHGKGVETHSNGDRYEGDWRNGKPHGKGVVIKSDGSRYEVDSNGTLTPAHIVLIIIWFLFMVLHLIYKLKFQYKNFIGQPVSYLKAKKFLKYGERLLIFLVVIFSISKSNYIPIIILPISMVSHYLVNFICFKREADRLYDLYIELQGMDHKSALELSTSTINRKIMNKEVY